MNRFWDHLRGIMESHLQYHQYLLDLAGEKMEALIAHDVDVLLPVLEKEEGMIKKIQALEEERGELLSQMNFPREISFQDLLAHAPQDGIGTLIQLQERLGLLLGKLKHINEGNAILINESLELNEFSIQLFTGGTEARAYRPNQGKMKEVHYRLFDEKA